MNAKAIVLAGLLATATLNSVGCAPAKQAQARTTAMATSGQADVLTQAALSDAQEKALRGDKDAAFKVALHYEATEGDGRRELQWMTIAAENGNTTAMQNLAVALHADGTRQGCLRAVYWLERLEMQTSPQLRKELLVADELKAFRRDCS